MNMKPVRVGDRIYTKPSTRFARQTGKVIAINDNPLAKTNHYHVRFDNDVRGAIRKREIWLGRGDFEVLDDGKC